MGVNSLICPFVQFSNFLSRFVDLSVVYVCVSRCVLWCIYSVHTGCGTVVDKVVQSGGSSDGQPQ